MALRMRDAGKSVGQVATEVGRRESSVAARFQTLDRIAAKAAAASRIKVRACLCCGADFKSDGPHNRLCQMCRRKDVSPFASF